jgi:CobQ-like glutamine amidotransferase family enzyme
MHELAKWFTPDLLLVYAVIGALIVMRQIAKKLTD